MKIRKDDRVLVITGDDRGKQGRVLRVLRDEDRVVVEGVNYIWKHLRKTQQNPQGGRLQKEAPISLSNVKVLGKTDSADSAGD
jgi:large subunit ribosomal protein L24